MGCRAGAAMRLLPVGSDHDRRGAADEDAEADRRADRHRDAGQHLPLWHLSTHSPRHQARGTSLRGGVMTKSLSRRTFLKTATAAGGGLMIGAWLPVGSARTAVAAGSFEPNIWIKVNTDDTVRIMLTMLEMGQG